MCHFVSFHTVSREYVKKVIKLRAVVCVLLFEGPVSHPWGQQGEKVVMSMGGVLKNPQGCPDVPLSGHILQVEPLSPGHVMLCADHLLALWSSSMTLGSLLGPTTRPGPFQSTGPLNSPVNNYLCLVDFPENIQSIAASPHGATLVG